MAIPSGTGTEVLRRGFINTQQTDVTAFLWNGSNPTLGNETYTVPANVIITLISFFVCETAGNAETFSVYLYDGASNIQWLQNQALAAKETFVWNMKAVLIGGDKLFIYLTAGDCDVYYSYMTQDWS